MLRCILRAGLARQQAQEPQKSQQPKQHEQGIGSPMHGAYYGMYGWHQFRPVFSLDNNIQSLCLQTGNVIYEGWPRFEYSTINQWLESNNVNVSATYSSGDWGLTFYMHTPWRYDNEHQALNDPDAGELDALETMPIIEAKLGWGDFTSPATVFAHDVIDVVIGDPERPIDSILYDLAALLEALAGDVKEKMDAKPRLR